MTWQSIETAPKDGSIVILSIPRKIRSVYFGKWTKYIKTAEWTCEGLHYNLNKKYQPTHWMPLPKPPEEQK